VVAKMRGHPSRRRLRIVLTVTRHRESRAHSLIIFVSPHRENNVLRFISRYLLTFFFFRLAPTGVVIAVSKSHLPMAILEYRHEYLTRHLRSSDHSRIVLVSPHKLKIKGDLVVSGGVDIASSGETFRFIIRSYRSDILSGLHLGSSIHS